jgi:transcriptional regulator with XRE-family HTH domain
VELQLKEAFGKVIRELRTEAGISQQELADYAEVDRSYISDLERGIYNPTLHVIYKLSEILKVKPHKVIEKVDKLLEK